MLSLRRIHASGQMGDSSRGCRELIKAESRFRSAKTCALPGARMHELKRCAINQLRVLELRETEYSSTYSRDSHCSWEPN
jgi:hypothetical protein